MDKWLETKQLQVHFVSAAGLVYKDGKVLLIRSERRGWEFPGGIVEQGEAILDGLKREIFEETGITVDENRDELFVINPLLFSTPGMTDESNALALAVYDLPDAEYAENNAENTEIPD